MRDCANSRVRAAADRRGQAPAADGALPVHRFFDKEKTRVHKKEPDNLNSSARAARARARMSYVRACALMYVSVWRTIYT